MVCRGLFEHTVYTVVEHLEDNGLLVHEHPSQPPPHDQVHVVHPYLYLDRDDTESDESDEDVLPSVEDKCQLLCKQIVSEIAGGLQQSTALRVLNVVKTHLGSFLPDQVKENMPETPYMLKKMAGLMEIKSFVRHFCPNGCRMFHGYPKSKTEKVKQEKCGICTNGWRLDDHGKPTCENLYYSLDDWCSKMYQIQEVADALDGWADRALEKNVEGIYRDSTDGSIIRSFLTEHREIANCCLPFELCCDGVVMYNASARTMTPIVMHCHALPPHMRTSLGCTYFAAALCSESKPDQLTLAPIVAQFAARAPISGTPHTIIDAHDREKHLHYFVSWLVNDLRGHAGPVLSKSSPAYRGVCAVCDVTGVRVGNVTLYPGAISSTGRKIVLCANASSRSSKNYPHCVSWQSDDALLG